MNTEKTFLHEWYTDDTLLLFDYFKEKKATTYTLKTILTDFHLLDKLGKGQMTHDSVEVFYCSDTPDGTEGTHDFDIAISVIVDLSAILLETFRKGKITLKDLYEYEKQDYPAFTIQAGEDELSLLLDELKAFIDNPTRYDLSKMMDEDELLEFAAACRKVYEGIQSFRQ